MFWRRKDDDSKKSRIAVDIKQFHKRCGSKVKFRVSHAGASKSLTGLALNLLPQGQIILCGVELTRRAFLRIHRPPVGVLLLQVRQKGQGRAAAELRMARGSGEGTLYTTGVGQVLRHLEIVEALVHGGVYNLAVRCHVTIHALHTGVVHPLERYIVLVVTVHMAIQAEQVLLIWGNQLI